MTTDNGTIWLRITPPAGLKRKQLAEAIADKLRVDLAYLGTPSFTYQVGQVQLDKHWMIPLPAGVAGELVAVIKAAAVQCGATLTLPDDYVEAAVAPEPEQAEAALDPAGAEEAEGVELTVTLPTTGWTQRTRANLQALLASKGPLISKALGIPATPVVFNDEDDTVAFPWFTSISPEIAREAVIPLLAALCQRGQDASRIRSTPPAPGNDKYTMRCFLMSLGFIGPEHKQARRILLAGLDGDAAWRTPKNGPAA